MIERVFTDEHKRKLIVRVNRSNIQIHTERKDLLDYQFDLNVELFKFLKEQAVKVWKTFTPKAADLLGRIIGNSTIGILITMGSWRFGMSLSLKVLTTKRLCYINLTREEWKVLFTT